MEQKKKTMVTDDEVEIEIAHLLADPDVKLAKAEERIRTRRRQYLYQLRSRRRRGMALRLMGINEDALRRRDPYDPMYEEELR